VALLTSLEREISKLQNNSRLKLNESLQLYEEGVRNGSLEGLQYALASAAESKKLCAQIQNESCYNQSFALMQKIYERLAGMEEGYKQRADNAYNDGDDQLLQARRTMDITLKRGLFQNASSEFTRALTIYGGLWNWAGETNYQDKRNAYSALIEDCKKKISEINAETQDCCLDTKPNKLFADGVTLYESGDCINASLKANEALALYRRIQESSGTFKTETLLYQINDCLNQTNEAELLLWEVVRYYRVADYENAELELEKAARIYEKIKNQEGIKRCAIFKQKISERVSAKKNAEDDLMTRE
jgi:exonuclease VII small subunit